MKFNLYIRQKRIALFFMALFCLTSQAQVIFSNHNQLPPKHEVRAVWLTTIGGLDWPHSYSQSARSAEKQKQELRTILDQLQQAGINTVLLQTRVRATTIYPSSIEPWDGCLSGIPGKSPGYDALAFAIDECHKRGMELHAWVVTMPVGKWNGPGCTELRRKQPHMLKRIGQEGYMNPESPLTAPYLARMCAEITRNYDIDGIHLDYIRYPETWTIKVSRQQGRAYITNIVKQVHDAVKQLKPWVKMSCSPIGKHDDLSRYWSHGWNAYTKVCQEAQNWLRDGLMDELFPMMYFRDNNFFPFALDWKERSHGRIVVPGLGIYFMSPREKNWPLSDITRELGFLRNNGLGHAYFRSKFFTDDTKGIYRFAKNELCLYPSLVPPMTWQSAERPQSAYSLRRENRADNTTLLSWQHNSKDTTMMLFNVYASTESPVNTDDARNILAVRRQSRELIVPRNQHLHYAICAVDRYGNESEPLQEAGASADFYGVDSDNVAFGKTLLACDGQNVEVPAAACMADTKFLLVESQLGCAIAVLPYQYGASASVKSLPDGMYVLRSLNKKGVSHRLGTFMKRQ